MHWKRSATPAGRSWWVLSTPELRTFGDGSGSLLPTPIKSDMHGSHGLHGNNGPKRCLPTTPRTILTPTKAINLAAPSMAKWAGHWGFLPSPTKNNFTSASPEELLQRRERCKATANNGNGFGLKLGNWMMLATPTKRGWRSGKASEATLARNSRPLNEQSEAMGLGGTLALLAISEWLQGYPPGWLARAWPPMETRSSRRSPRPSETPSGEPTKR